MTIEDRIAEIEAKVEDIILAFGATGNMQALTRVRTFASHRQAARDELAKKEGTTS